MTAAEEENNTRATPTENLPFGLKLFSYMQDLVNYGSSSFEQHIPSSSPATDTSTSTTTTTALNHHEQHGQHEQYEKVEEEQHGLMDEIMPIETWKVMKNNDRAFFLDKFYPIRRKYLYEKEGRELCAFEEKQLYECDKDSRKLRNFFQASSPGGGDSNSAAAYDDRNYWARKLDGCYDSRQEFRRCVLLMTMALKTQAVFGNDKRYLRIIDKESRDNPVTD